ncbi:MAG: cobalamin-dependent protein [Thermodesulfobacteriota bacterium]|nr:cobalamin-dependent protein [Thermodesulfobacteriota bacterium]
MANKYIVLISVFLYLLVVLVIFQRGTVSFSSRYRKPVKWWYFVPLLVYIFLTTAFASQIISFIGPSRVSVFCSPIGDRVVYWMFPELNIIFLAIYLFTVLAVLTYWEPIVKYSENTPYLAPVFGLLVVNFTNLFFFGDITEPQVVKPLVVWLIFMIATMLLGAFIVIKDLKRGLKREIARKKVAQEQDAAQKKKKLLLIYPINELIAGLTVRSYSVNPPLAMAILAGLTPRDQFHISFLDEQFEPFVYEDADLVAITAFTAYANRAYEIAALYRENGTPVVMGGIHATMCTDEALNYVDCVVRGEAEDVWADVLRDFLDGNLKRVYEGTWPELKNMPQPDRSIFDSRYVSSSIQTSRGCPWNCKYCSVTAFNGHRYRERPVNEILDELETIPNRYLFFIDDNLIGYSKASEQRALDLFKGMVDRKIYKRWITQTTIDIGNKPELLKWAARSGCLLLFIGLEFIDREELKQMDKHFALKVDYSKALKNINRAGIGVIGAFIYGSDYDTREKMLKRAEFVRTNRIDAMQQSKMTAFPETQVFKQLKAEGRIIYTDYPEDWEKYNFYELTHVPLNMEREEFIRTFRYCVSKTYAYRTIWIKALKTLWHTRNLETAAAAMRLNFSYRALSLYHMENQLSQEQKR